MLLVISGSGVVNSMAVGMIMIKLPVVAVVVGTLPLAAAPWETISVLLLSITSDNYNLKKMSIKTVLENSLMNSDRFLDLWKLVYIITLNFAGIRLYSKCTASPRG